MFIPLHDDNPLRRVRVAYVTWGLIALNVGIFAALQGGWLLDRGPDPGVTNRFGMFPAVLFGHAVMQPDPWAGYPWEGRAWLSLVSYMFLHGSWWHLATNMLFLKVFGDNVEDDLGHGRYLFFYLACGVLAGLVYAGIASTSQSPLIGASGAVSGVVAAYLLLHPRNRIWVLVFVLPLRLPAAWAMGAWVALQAWMAWTAPPGASVGWFAHLGGLGVGAVLATLLHRPDVPLFDRMALPLSEMEAEIPALPEVAAEQDLGRRRGGVLERDDAA